MISSGENLSMDGLLKAFADFVEAAVLTGGRWCSPPHIMMYKKVH